MSNKAEGKRINKSYSFSFRITAVTLALVTAFFVSQARSATYYVATTGNDANTAIQAQNIATPWKTIQKAADTMVAGDTVEVQAGTYNTGFRDGGHTGDALYPLADPMVLRSRVFITTSGTAAQPITYHANGLVIVEGASAAHDIDNCFYLYKVQFVVIDGFTCANASGALDVAALPPLEHYGQGVGIMLDMSSNCTIQNNICYNNHDTGISVGRVYGLGTGEITGVYSRGSCNSNNILRNVCYDNGRQDSTELGGKWGAGIVVFGNGSMAHQGWNGAGGWDTDGPDAEWSNFNNVRYNYCYNNTAKGIGIIGYGQTNWIEFNILVNNFKPISNEGAGIVVFRHYYASISYIRSNTIDGHIQGHIQRSAVDNGTGIYTSDVGNANVGIINNIITGNTFGIWRGNETAYNAVAPTMSNGYNNVWGNVSNFVSCPTLTGDTNYDPQYRVPAHTGVWSTAFILKRKYNFDRSLSGDALSSPCLDTGVTLMATLPDLKAEKGAHVTEVDVGYPDPPTTLGWADASFVNGSWHNDRSSVNLSYNLADPVVPNSVDNIRASFQIQYEAQSYIPTYANTDPPGGLWYSAPPPYPQAINYIYSGMSTCYEGQYHWRVACEDRTLNISTWTYANSNNIAFGLDITRPTVVNDLAGTTTVGASSATLIWSDVDDSLPTTVPGTPPPPGYKRVSDVATYNIYRSTFSCAAPWTWNTWKAQVIALNTNQRSKRIVEPRGAGLAGAPHSKIDGLIVGDTLIPGMSYYYIVTSIDNAGNESIQGNEISINAGNPPPGGALVYLIGSGGQVGGGDKTPCYGTTVPAATDVLVAINVSTTTCNLTQNSNAAYVVGNDHIVRHYAKITTGVGANPAEIRFYYTTGTRRTGAGLPGEPEVWTNKDTGFIAMPPQYYINGTPYVPVGVVDPTATYFYADIPTDINACGDNIWDASSPWGVVGVRVSGHPRTNTSLPLADSSPEWVNENPGTANTYTYYVRRTPGYKAANPGEKIDDVRLQSMKHVWSDLLQSAATALRYFMPIDAAPADNLSMNINRFTVTGLGDGKGDIFYGEYPGLYVRLAYADGEVGAGNSYITYRSSTTAFDTGWLDDNSLDPVSAAVVSGIDNAAGDSFAGGLAGPFYGHFSFLKSPVNTFLMSLPEGIDVRYYFDIKDGTQRGYCYGGGATTTEATAQGGTLFCYTVMQDDYSRPYVKFTASDTSALQPRSVTDPGNSSWISYYTVSAELWDMNDGNNSAVPAVYGNVVSGRGDNSGIYRNPNPNALGTAAPRSPVHDTRVYYRISATSPPGGLASDKYLTSATVPDFNFIPDNADTIYALAGDTTGYAQMSGPSGGGMWTAQIPLKESYAGQFIYYRVYVCNNDNDPQAYDSPSANFITGVGVDQVGADTGDVYNRHSPAGVGSAFADPFDAAPGGACDIDRDHGWATYTRYGGRIIGLKMIKIRSRVTIGGITKTITAYVNAEGGAVGNVIFTEMEKTAP